jgi:hypothetical protein
MIDDGIRMRFGMHQLIKRDLKQIAHWQISQWARQQPVDHGIDIAEMAQRAVGYILHGATLLRTQGGMLPPDRGQFGIKAAAGKYPTYSMGSKALGAFHIQGILCGLNIQAIARMEGGTGKK